MLPVQKMIKLQSLIIIAMTAILGLSLLFNQQSLSLVFFSGYSSAVIPELPLFKSALADHGQEVTLTLHNSSFGSLSSGGGNQVSIFASYELNDNSIPGQTINAVMEVYAPNGSLIRTSSYPNGFVAQSSGGVEGLETTIRDSTVQSVTANVTFRNLERTAILSNDLRVDLNLDGAGTAPTVTTGEEGVGLEEETLGLDSELEEGPPQPTDQGESGLTDEDEGQDEGQELPLPLFG
jgi:hypothetical protein